MTQCWLGEGGLGGGDQKWWGSYPRARAMQPRYPFHFTESIYTPAAGKVWLPALSCQPLLGMISSDGSHLFLSVAAQTQGRLNAGA